jgi:predicted NBD/HSP70 family sugar kinase
MVPDTETLSSRQVTRLRVIETLYRRPATGRAELARLTGVSRRTVSSLIEELGRAGVVEEHSGIEETRPRGTGRPPILLSLVPGAAFAVGLDIGHRHIRVVVCDLVGRPVADESVQVAVDGAPVESLDIAAELVGRALEHAAVDRRSVIGVGMGLATPINKRTGELEAHGILPGWQGIRPAAEMEQRLGTRVELENDANVGALGEWTFGAGKGVADLAYIRLSEGVGAGLILGGRPYQGARGIAGEIGHVVTHERGRICKCGNRGCLETVATPSAIAALLPSRQGEPVAVEELLHLVQTGDRGARRAVRDAGAAIGRALAMLVNILDIELVVVGGDLAPAGDVLLDSVRDAIERDLVAPAADPLRVVAGTLGDRAEALGAAALILARSPQALAGRVASA